MACDNGFFKQGTYRGLKFFMECGSLIRVFVPSINIFEEEVKVGFLSVFDLILLPWILFVIISGVQLKKINLPNWFPPVPVVLLLVSFVISCLFGFLQTEVDSLGDSLKVVLVYGLGNGCLIGLVAMASYDCVHGFIKKNWTPLKNWFKRVFGKTKEVKE